MIRKRRANGLKSYPESEIEAFVQNPKSEAVLENMVFAHFGRKSFLPCTTYRTRSRPAAKEAGDAGKRGIRDYREVIGSVAA